MSYASGSHTEESPKELASYQQMVHELSVTSERIVSCIVIPKSLRTQTGKLAHGGHQGIVKTKRLIQSRVWFQGIDDQVEQHVRHSQECQSNTDRQSFETLKPSKMPEKPWQSVSADFFGPTPGG